MDPHVADRIRQALSLIGDSCTAAYISTSQLPQRRTAFSLPSLGFSVGLATLARDGSSFANGYLIHVLEAKQA